MKLGKYIGTIYKYQCPHCERICEIDSGDETDEAIVDIEDYICNYCGEVFTMFEDDDSIFAAIVAGARGYLLKGASQESVADAIEAVARGEAIFGPSIADRVLTSFTRRAEPAVEPFPELTDRERQVLELVASGETNMTIARELGAAEKTVRNHVSNILTKLQVLDRAQAVIRARDAGYGSAGRGLPFT